RFAREDGGKAEHLGLQVRDGAGYEVVDALKDRHEAGTLAVYALDARGGKYSFANECIAELLLTCICDFLHHSPLWMRSICALAPKMRSLFTMSAAPYASRSARVRDSSASLR